jgi:hypothetical protein
MTMLSQRLAERLLLGCTAIAAALLFHSFASGAAEPPGCANNTCKMIRFFYNCNLLKGWVEKDNTCLYCSVPSGRCNNGNNNACTDSGVKRQFQAINVNRVCLCVNTPNGTGNVEASGHLHRRILTLGG